MKSVTVKAYGKVNLGLDVIGRREDGYHLVKMVMQTVDLYDDVTVTAAEQEQDFENQEGEPRIQITCDVPSVPSDQRNLAYKAAERICRKYQMHPDLRIQIQKRIPVEAGMAGGSADAAAVIDAMDELFAFHMTEAEKDEIALSLGADVPFCLRRGTYLSEGIGEKLTRISDLPHCYMVIVKPPISVSTAWAYQTLDTYMAREDAPAHPDIDHLIGALAEGTLEAIASHMGNILETVTIQEHPEIQRIKDQLDAFGALKSLMSGSGPTVFGIFSDQKKADDAFTHLEGENSYGKFKIEF